MWPREVPAEIRANPLRRAECRVYDRLKEELSDEYEVFYSRPWFGLNQYGEEIDGECDFVVAHAEHGFLALEVKGGGISRNPETEVWYTTDRYGIRSRIKNPVQQAVSSKHKLLEKLLKQCHDLGWIRTRHGVVFPDAESFEGSLAADIPKQIVCCEPEFEHAFGHWITQRLEEPESGGRRLGEGFRNHGMACIRELLAKPIHLSIPIGKRLRDDDLELQVLTQQQFHLLETISHVERAAIMGGAGTGKTVLAVEEALRLAREANRTALVCFNRGLAEMLRSMQKIVEKPRLEAATLHSLLWRCAGNEADRNALQEDQLPSRETVSKALEAGKFQPYDALVVDEGQDFPPEWWASLLLLLKPAGWLRIFWDSNQSVYSALPNLPGGVNPVPIILNRNLRNTSSIWSAAKPFYSGIPIEPVGPPGVVPAIYNVSTRLSAMQLLSRLVGEWSKDSTLDNLAVLVPDTRWRDDVFQLLRELGIKARKCDEKAEGAIAVDTLRRFKGLEARDVLLVLDESCATRREILYVGITRARVRLGVIMTTPIEGLHGQS